MVGGADETAASIKWTHGDENMSNYLGAGAEWDDLVGEMTRGGNPMQDTLSVLGAEGAYHLLGEMVQRSPAMAQFVQNKIAASRPLIRRAPVDRARDWDFPIGPVSGSAATTTTITVNPQTLFRVEKIMATDVGALASGYNTSVTQVIIGNKLQRPATTGGTLTLFFANNALGNGVKWDTCQPALTISFTVSFIVQSTFYGTLWGKAAY
jgi:hypothetical protein